jgi:hypothetical protein
METSAQLFDAIMMICFGAAWPVAIIKTVRTKRVIGKSVFFLFLVATGYLSGITYKFLEAGAPDGQLSWVVALYTLNFTMVTIEICLWFRYREGRQANGRRTGQALEVEVEPPAVEVHRQKP